LLLCGLVRSDRLKAESERVRPSTFLLGLLGVGLSVLLLPLAKLWLVGARSRFSRFDVALLVTSALLATLLAVVTVLSFVARDRLAKRLDDQLAKVTGDVKATLRRDIERGAKGLEGFVAKTRDLQDALRRRAGADTVCPGGVREPGGQGAAGPLPVCEWAKANAADAMGSGDWHSNDWRAFWVNRDGDQQIKVTPVEHATNPISVGRRAYFRRALDRPQACPSGAVKCDTFDVVRSATTGEIDLEVVRATRSDHDRGEVTGVAAVQISLRKFDDAVTPLGFQVAVVDGAGQVKVHSNNEAHQGQRILDDMRDGDALRAALAPGADEFLDLAYLGVPSRIHVQHLPDADWYVIAIARSDLIDVPVAAMVLWTMAGFFALMVLTLVVVGLDSLVRGAYGGRRAPAQLRPDASRIEDYARLALRSVFAGTTVVIVAVLWHRPLLVFLATIVVLAVHCARRWPGLSAPRYIVGWTRRRAAGGAAASARPRTGRRGGYGNISPGHPPCRSRSRSVVLVWRESSWSGRPPCCSAALTTTRSSRSFGRSSRTSHARSPLSDLMLRLPSGAARGGSTRTRLHRSSPGNSVRARGSSTPVRSALRKTSRDPRAAASSGTSSQSGRYHGSRSTFRPWRWHRRSHSFAPTRPRLLARRAPSEIGSGCDAGGTFD
jgi:hypothetical protein